MRILFTGATGVLGREAVPRLVAHGHDVRAVARAQEGRAWLEEIGARPVGIDLFDPAEVMPAVEGVDTLIHFATAIPSQAQMPKREAWAVNDRLRSEATRLLVDAALVAGVARFVQQSITFVYADGGGEWIDESSPVQPVSTILDSALDAEGHVERFRRGGGTGVTLRLSRLYGPGKVSGELIDGVRAQEVPVLGDGSNMVSSLHIEDAAKALTSALLVDDGTYNVSDEEPVTAAESMDTLARLLDAPVPRRVSNRRARIGPGRSTASLTVSQRVSNARFREASGWVPRLPSVREGWAEVVKAFRAGRVGR